MAYAINHPWSQVNLSTVKIVDEAYISTPAENTGLTTTYEKMNGTWTDPQIEGFIINGAGNLEYNADEDVDMVFWAAGSVSTGSTNTDVTVALEHEGTVIPGSETTTRCFTAGVNYGLAFISGKATMTKGDELVTVIKVGSGTVDVTAQEFTFVAMKSY